MFRLCQTVLVVLAGVLMPAAGQAGADALNIKTVPVGDPGNAADTTGYGAVAYKFQIGKYDVTNAQYGQFLNAKAASGDPRGLWNDSMSSDPNGGINRSGSGPYKYAVKPGQGNQPVVFVSWYTAIRFANWLTNGQGNGDTESGAYRITGNGPDWTVAVPDTPQRAKWAAGSKRHWLLPSENEWYKAAYYKGRGANAGYWMYPTRSNTVPTSQAPLGGPNSANFYNLTTGFAVTGTTIYDPAQNYLTNVGAYLKSVSAYGTFDQGGDVFQWNEALIDSSRGLRGGLWGYYSGNLASSSRSHDIPTLESYFVGFRVASVP